MGIVKRGSVAACLCGLIASWCSAASGQVFNIDFGDGGGIPGRGFPAASSGLDAATFWNNVSFDDLAPETGFDGPEVELVDEFSHPSPVTLQMFVQSGGSATITDPGFDGDAAGLLADGLAATDIPLSLTVRNLAPGSYRVTAYSTAGDNSFGTLTSVFGDITGTIGATPWTGDFVVGHTHFEQIVFSDDGELEVAFAAGQFGDTAVLTGLQIASVVPEPSSGAIALLAATAFVGWRRRR